MKIPHSFQLGVHTWRVYVSDIPRDHDCIGLCIKEKHEIHLGNHLAENPMNETFFHELIHACLDHLGIRDDETWTEEDICSRLANPLLQATNSFKYEVPSM